MRFGTVLGMTLTAIAGTFSLAVPARATIHQYMGTLNAGQVVDGGGSTSTATGSAVVTVDDSSYTVTTDLTWSGLSGPADRAHLHFAPIGVSRSVADPNTYFFHEVLDDPDRTIAGCNLGYPDCVPPSGTSSDVLQLSADDGYGAGLALGFSTNSFADLVLALNQGDIYVDMHTALYPSGEIRGQLAAVPEPFTWAMTMLGFASFGFVTHRRKNKIATDAM